MKKHTDKFLALIFFTVIVAILYLFVAFTEWNFNPKEWHACSRSFLSIFSAIALVITVVIFGVFE